MKAIALWLSLTITPLFLLGNADGLAQSRQVVVAATDDTSIYQDSADLSNGQGDFLFVGRIATGLRRRALVRFADLSAIPGNAEITEVKLSLTMSRANEDAGDLSVSVHALTAAWGEGSSNAGTPGGKGASAAAGDATWAWRIYPDIAWTMAGGDRVTEASGSELIGQIRSYTWGSTERLVADVSRWRADPCGNFGWLLQDRLSAPLAHARRFNSRHHPDPATHPHLLVRFEVKPFRDGFEAAAPTRDGDD